jgi:hypothetical protein
MKALILTSLMVISFTACAAKDADKKADAKAAAKPVDAKTATTTAPCDSKEDVLKKLEEKKKEASTGKAFSLQGNTDTGCKVK